MDYANPQPDQINIIDIATALSRECRYAGHASHFYSVAQHSVLCSRVVLPEFAIEALLHDAAEAYLKDIPSPLKAMLTDYKLLEERFDQAVRVHFGLPQQPSPAVKEADNILLVTEIRDLFCGRVLHKMPIHGLSMCVKDKRSAQAQRVAGVDQSRMVVTRHEAWGNTREPDGTMCRHARLPWMLVSEIKPHFSDKKAC